MEVKVYVFWFLVAVISCSLVNGTNMTTKGHQPTTTSSKIGSGMTTKTSGTATGKTSNKPTAKPSTGTKASTKAATTQGDTTKATEKPDIPCEERNKSCSFCTDDSSCFYCSTDKSCRKYHRSKIIPRHCNGNKWYWKQCKVPGNILIIVIPTVGGVLLIMLGCCVYCCCCRRRCCKSTAAQEEARQRQNRQDRQQRNEERRQTRRARHDAIRMKYGLLQNQDDDDLEKIV